MRSIVLLVMLLFSGVASQCQNIASPYTNSVFKPQTFTHTGQTGPVIQLNGLTPSAGNASTVGSSYASLTVTVAGTSLTTVTFAIQGSADNGVTFFPLPIFIVASPASPPALSITATVNGLYQVNSAGLTHIRAVTSGTFTATSVTLTFTGSPNALISRSNSGGTGGATTPATVLLLKGLNAVNGVGAAEPGTDYVIPAGNVATADAALTAATATELAGNPELCADGEAPTGILPNGDVTGCAPLGASTPPAGIPADVQTNLNGTAFGADPGNFKYTAGTTHRLDVINQAMSGFLTQNVLNNNDATPATAIESDSNQPGLPDGTGENDGLRVTGQNSGVGMNVGNPPGFTSGVGWRVVKGMVLSLNGFAAGIHQILHMDGNIPSSGDSAAIYQGNSEGFSACMWVDASGEGCVGVMMNGAANIASAIGTITSTIGLGDQNPVFSITPSGSNGGNTLINDGLIMDLSLTTLTTTLQGAAAANWETTQFGSLAVTPGSATPSTGMCVLTTNVPNSSVPGTYQTQNFSCTVHDAHPLATGLVMMASNGGPEQCKILTVSGSGTQTGTVSCAKFHPIATYMFQGGTRGVGDFGDDLTVTGLHSAVYVLGAPDADHLLIAQRLGGQFIGGGLPVNGMEPAGLTLTGSFVVHPGVLCRTTNTTNTQCTLEVNDIAWAPAHNFASPQGMASLETMGEFRSSQTAPDNGASPGVGVTVVFQGTTHHAHLHPAFRWDNQAPLSDYMNSGVGTGWLAAPPFLWQTGPYSNAMVLNTSPLLGINSTPCGGRTIICNMNSTVSSATIELYSDVQQTNRIEIDGTNKLFSFIDNAGAWGIKTNNLQVGGPGSFGGELTAGSGLGIGSSAQGTVNTSSVEIFGIAGDFGCPSGFGLTTHISQFPDGRIGGIKYNVGDKSPVWATMCFSIDNSGNLPFVISSMGAAGPYEIEIAANLKWNGNLLTGIAGKGANLLTYTGAAATSGHLFAANTDGTATDSGIDPATLATLAGGNTFAGSNVFSLDTVFSQRVAAASLNTAVFTVATLPVATDLPAGTQVIVSDSASFTPGVCAGAGTNLMIAVTDGTTWTCH